MTDSQSQCLDSVRRPVGQRYDNLDQHEPSAMTILLAQIAPQRSTQYTALADVLAPHELALSRLRDRIGTIDPIVLGGQHYLRVELTSPPDEDDVLELGTLAMTSAFFLLYERLGHLEGPFLQPIEPRFVPSFSRDLALTRRYKGKTNELFTHFLCNLAHFSSAWAHEPWNAINVFDPLAGGGTTLFTALMLGASAAGVEKDATDVQSTATFVSQYFREQGIPCTVQEERLRKFGHRWSFKIGKGTPKRLILARGDTAQSAPLMTGFKPHLIVTDLPYGLQHHGELSTLLQEALPVWTGLLPPGGALTFAWDATRFPRADMIDLVESVAALSVLDQPPYSQLAHRVDRVIKQRDVIVARHVSADQPHEKA